MAKKPKEPKKVMETPAFIEIIPGMGAMELADAKEHNKAVQRMLEKKAKADKKVKELTRLLLKNE